MQFFRSMNISSSSIEAARLRMETSSLNLANAESAAADPDNVFRPRRVKLGEAFEELKNGFDNRSVSRGVKAEVLLQPEAQPRVLLLP